MTIVTEPAAAPDLADRPVRVGIADDHESVRLGIKAACENTGFEVVFAAATVRELVDGIAGREVDVIVLDLSLGDGSLVTDNVHLARGTGASVLVHSIADRVALVREALAAGAAGVIPKSSATKTVIAAAASLTTSRGCSVTDARPLLPNRQSSLVLMPVNAITAWCRRSATVTGAPCW